MQTGTSVLMKNEDVESEAVETVASIAGASDSAAYKEAPSPPAVQVSEEAEDDAEEADGWETTSVIEALLDDVNPYFDSGPNVCTPAESQRYRKRLHEIGLEEFVQETLGKGTITARKLCSAFNARIPPWLDEDASDETFYQLLGLALVRELEKRQRLPQYATIDDAAKLLNSAKNVMVITGAGVSTSLGIPDFRSKDSGFYTKLREKGFAEPEDVFELSTFDDDPTIFYSLAGDILPELGKWTPTHQFIRLLQDKGKLLRNYTQNIDNIEGNAGILPDKLVQCHGSWATATCRKCKHQVPGEQIFEHVRAKRVAYCKRCVAQLQVPGQGMKRKRSSNGNGKAKKRSGDSDDDSDGQYDIPEPGVMKPDITFFGEKLPDTFFDRLTEHDRDKVDLVIVMGTSMKVAPVSEIPSYLPASVPQMYISKDPIHHINFDINLLGNSDTVVLELCRRAGWNLEHEMIPKEQEIEVVPADEMNDNVFLVKSV